MSSYGEDLAYINDEGFSDFTNGTSPGVLALLRRAGVTSGLVVDLGCGSGRWAQMLGEAGYEVLGVDQSPAMIQLARARAPRASFHTGSMLTAQLPGCDAVTAIGEIVNYQFDPRHSRTALRRLFRRVYTALRPGGVFVFDVAGPYRVPEEVPRWYGKEGPGWSIHVEVDGCPRRLWMTRKIVCFRQCGAEMFRRSEELHRLRLMDVDRVAADLRAAGFGTRTQSGYGRFRLYPGMHAVVARKPR